MVAGAGPIGGINFYGKESYEASKNTGIVIGALTIGYTTDDKNGLTGFFWGFGGKGTGLAKFSENNSKTSTYPTVTWGKQQRH